MTVSQPLADSFRRVLVIGTTGSGKTTLARQLATKHGLTHIEADNLYFLADWEVRPSEEFQAIVAEKTAGNDWIIDGNYGILRNVLWPRADTLIWLDYTFHITLWRLTKRTLKRAWTQESLWEAGNRESLIKQFQLNSNSLFYWFFKTYWKRKRDTPALFKEYPHLHVLHFTHPRETEAWLTKG